MNKDKTKTEIKVKRIIDDLDFGKLKNGSPEEWDTLKKDINYLCADYFTTVNEIATQENRNNIQDNPNAKKLSPYWKDIHDEVYNEIYLHLYKKIYDDKKLPVIIPGALLRKTLQNKARAMKTEFLRRNNRSGDIYLKSNETKRKKIENLPEGIKGKTFIKRKNKQGEINPELTLSSWDLAKFIYLSSYYSIFRSYPDFEDIVYESTMSGLCQLLSMKTLCGGYLKGEIEKLEKKIKTHIALSKIFFPEFKAPETDYLYTKVLKKIGFNYGILESDLLISSRMFAIDRIADKLDTFSRQKKAKLSRRGIAYMNAAYRNSTKIQKLCLTRNDKILEQAFYPDKEFPEDYFEPEKSFFLSENILIKNLIDLGMTKESAANVLKSNKIPKTKYPENREKRCIENDKITKKDKNILDAIKQLGEKDPDMLREILTQHK